VHERRRQQPPPLAVDGARREVGAPRDQPLGVAAGAAVEQHHREHDEIGGGDERHHDRESRARAQELVERVFRRRRLRDVTDGLPRQGDGVLEQPLPLRGRHEVERGTGQDEEREKRRGHVADRQPQGLCQRGR
jgi:hypothetical protein